MADYDPQNVFAKILRGEMPAQKIYEDEAAIAIMDVMPQADGHVLVIPKAPSRNLLDMDAEVLGPLFAAVQTVARAVKKALGAEGITITQFNEAPAGQSVFHAHVHILPRWTDVPLRPHTSKMEKPEVLAAHADKIKAALRG
ncbi:HIT family protein [Chelatococcus sambhunathii]|uniref:HIT family protein n=1 Tax=Chelatococcus sambhunathii TaxID=363953 RepID=A0ABU1DE96_9HYPH|nr:HIT family protein [Chelatococcus sambhunathii]MDR4306436.1 HIT family protein [Chelatococcus sambhunathii]